MFLHRILFCTCLLLALLVSPPAYESKQFADYRSHRPHVLAVAVSTNYRATARLELDGPFATTVLAVARATVHPIQSIACSHWLASFPSYILIIPQLGESCPGDAQKTFAKKLLRCSGKALHGVV